MYNVLVNCEFFHVISQVNKLKETSGSLSDELRAKLSSKVTNFVSLYSTSMTVC